MDRTVRILLADDDAEDRFILLESLRETGFAGTVDSVEDGVEAIKHLEGAVITGTLPVVILLDLNMPRLNGTETLRRIKKNPDFRYIPVIIFSTSVNEIEKEECLKLGAASYLTKPGSYAEALATAKYFREFAEAVIKDPAYLF
jgi:CheY-like chemotaxis protein